MSGPVPPRRHVPRSQCRAHGVRGHLLSHCPQRRAPHCRGGRGGVGTRAPARAGRHQGSLLLHLLLPPPAPGRARGGYCPSRGRGEAGGRLGSPSLRQASARHASPAWAASQRAPGPGQVPRSGPWHTTWSTPLSGWRWPRGGGRSDLCRLSEPVVRTGPRGRKGNACARGPGSPWGQELEEGGGAAWRADGPASGPEGFSRTVQGTGHPQTQSGSLGPSGLQLLGNLGCLPGARGGAPYPLLRWPDRPPSRPGGGRTARG